MNVHFQHVTTWSPRPDSEPAASAGPAQTSSHQAQEHEVSITIATKKVPNIGLGSTKGPKDQIGPEEWPDYCDLLPVLHQCRLHEFDDVTSSELK